MLVILLLAKLAGEQTLSGAAHWARLRASWLQQVLGMRRLPCAKTYHYISAHLDVAVLNRLLSEWFAQVAPALAPGELMHWAIDGKGLLKHWVRAAKGDGSEAFPGHGRLKASDEEVRRLQRENAILRQERDILKKAIAIFSQPPKPSTDS